MALSNEVDRTMLRENMATWFGKNVPDVSDVVLSEVDIPQESGLSALTILFNAEWRLHSERKHNRFVARAMANNGGVFEKSSLKTEHDVLATLSAHTDVAVPCPRGLELEDSSICGMPFMLMDFLPGRVPRDDPPYTVSGWVTELTDQERQLLSDNAFGEMAKLHNVDYEAIGLEWLKDVPMGSPGMRDKLDGWERYYRWCAGKRTNTLVESALRWLRQNIPDETAPVISWGDCRVGNVIFGDDLKVAALIDWEMVGLGAREVDIGWWIFTRRFHTSIIDVPLPNGFPTEPELLNTYEKLTGHCPQNIDYYIAFAGLRLTLAMMRLGFMMIENGQLPENAAMPYSNPASHLLADCIGIERPAGGMMDFVGNR
jgi:aminoglycoside phosphotransferase (APT) family kinase protein